jgi:ribosome biogenesis GTPase
MSEPEAGAYREGIVIRASAGSCLVRAEGETWRCQLRGRLKRGRRRTQTVVVVGDRVGFRDLGRPAEEAARAEGVVEEVHPRRNRISRWAARRAGGRVEQVLMANLDQVVAVQSLAEPPPQGDLVDRLLVAAELYGVPGLLCLNKVDLDPAAALAGRWSYYERLGYGVLRTSVVTGEGCDELASHLTDGISLLVGASGVGKSSLLNAVEPGLDLRVGEVTGRTGLGRHTTTRTELFPLRRGGFIADSPGLRGFDPWGVDPGELRDYFPDFTTPAESCRFRTCLHRDEPDCGVKAAVVRGEVPAWRHDAYLAMLNDVEERTATGERRRD